MMVDHQSYPTLTGLPTTSPERRMNSNTPDSQPEFRTAPKDACLVCGGRKHRHGANLVEDFECYWRQYSSTILTNGRMLELSPTQLSEFAKWLKGGNAHRRPKRSRENEAPDPNDRVYF
jgi:hypothetical protein